MKGFRLCIAVLFLLLTALSETGVAIDIDIGDLGVGLGLMPPPVEIKGRLELVPIPGRYTGCFISVP